MVSSEPTILYAKLGLYLPGHTIFHLSALNFICLFTAQSLASMRTFSSSTESFLFLINMITLQHHQTVIS